jgi:hypothetical protein
VAVAEAHASTRASPLKGGESGPAIVPGLVHRAPHDSCDFRLTDVHGRVVK